MYWTKYRYIKIVDKRVEVNEVLDRGFIKSLFDFCAPEVQENLKDWFTFRENRRGKHFIRFDFPKFSVIITDRLDNRAIRQMRQHSLRSTRQDFLKVGSLWN